MRRSRSSSCRNRKSHYYSSRSKRRRSIFSREEERLDRFERPMGKKVNLEGNANGHSIFHHTDMSPFDVPRGGRGEDFCRTWSSDTFAHRARPWSETYGAATTTSKGKTKGLGESTCATPRFTNEVGYNTLKTTRIRNHNTSSGFAECLKKAASTAHLIQESNDIAYIVNEKDDLDDLVRFLYKKTRVRGKRIARSR